MRYALICLFVQLVLASLGPGVARADYGVFKPSEFSPHQARVVLVPWDSPRGRQRFARARFKEDFFQLAPSFQPQINPLYCGIASSVMVLNALRLGKGTVPSQSALEIATPPQLGGTTLPFPSYSQLTFLNAETDRVKPQAVIELKNLAADPHAIPNPGLALAELQALLQVYRAQAALYYADDPNPQRAARELRRRLRSVLAERRQFLIVNFKGVTLGAATGGHISPVAAYDAASDSVLLLDVAGHKNPWYWVPVTHLYQAMHTRDGEHYRGYLLVSDMP